MSSKRLPGKVLKEVLGRPLLSYLIERIRSINNIDQIILATTINPQDDVLERFALDNKLECFRGSEDDVMGRVIGAGEKMKAEILVEITGDCPLLDSEIAENIIDTYLHNDADYVSNCHIRSYPDGMDVQVFSLDNLKKSASMTNDQIDREHVSLHMRKHPDLFKHYNVIAPRTYMNPNLGLTLDEGRDYVLIKKIIECLYPNSPNFSCREILQFLAMNPKLVSINSEVKRKGNA